MTNMSASSSEAAGALSLPQRFVGVLFSPRPTFESVVARPAWLGMLAILFVVTLAGWSTFLWTESGRQALIDQAISRMEQNGQPVTAEAEEGLSRSYPFIRGVTLVIIAVTVPLITVVTAGILFGVFGAVLGGEGSFKQVMAVVVHAGVISTIAGLFTIALNYLRQSMTSATTLSVFVPMLPEDHIVTRFLGSIDLVMVWYLAILAIGLGVLYRRKGTSIFLSFMGIYVVIALIIAIVRSAMGGS